MASLLESWKQRFDRTSIGFRLFFTVVLPVILVVTATAAYLLEVVETHFERRMEEDVEMVARSLQLPVSHALERHRVGSLGKSLTSAIRIGRVYGVRLYDREGEVITSTIAGDDETAPQKVTQLDDIDDRHHEYEEVGGRQVYSYFVPLFGSGQRLLGSLQVTRRKADFRQLMSRIRWVGGGVLLLLVVLISAVAFGGYHTAVGRALRRLRESMGRIEEGERDHRAEQTGPREIASLAADLNDMLDSLQEAERRVRRQRRRAADLKDELRESEKMAAVGRVSAGVAHELGTPLSTLSGHLQRLDGGLDDDRADKSIEAMSRETERMESIIQQMLDFGRTSEGERSVVTPAQTVAFCRTRLDDLARREGASLQVEGPEAGEPRIEVTPARIEQAFANLVGNAARAASGGEVRLSWRFEGEYVEFLVDDDGPGVDPDIRDRLFEPFVTTRAEDGGAGLGLAIVEAVAREHRGYASVDASPMGGARFQFAVPVADSNPDAPRSDPQGETDVSG